MRVHLLEPYRTAFVARCVREGLIEVVPKEVEAESAGLALCGSDELVNDALQLAVLASDVSMVWTDGGSVALARGLPHMKASGIEHLGVLDLVAKYPDDIAEQQKTRWQSLSNVDDLWQLERDEIDSLSPLILSQMEARGKGLHWSLFRLLRALRLGEDRAVPVILSAVPPQLQRAAESILQIKPRLMHEIELPFIMTLQELRLTAATAGRRDARMAGAAPLVDGPRPDLATSGSQLWGLVVEELLGEQIQFPVPRSIRDVIVLRSRSEVADFRAFLIPFLDAVLTGQEDAARSLRASVKDCVKAFRRFPLTQRLARWTSYAGLAADVVEAVSGWVGIGIGTGLVGLGLEGLARKWKDQSSWVYMGTSGAA